MSEPAPSPEVSFVWRGSPAAFFSPMVASNRSLPHGVNGGGFRKVVPTPWYPHTPDKSRGLKLRPSTLYLAFASFRSCSFWHRGQDFHPGGGGTEATGAGFSVSCRCACPEALDPSDSAPTSAQNETIHGCRMCAPLPLKISTARATRAAPTGRSRRRRQDARS